MHHKKQCRLLILLVTMISGCSYQRTSPQGVISWNTLPFEQSNEIMNLFHTQHIQRLYQYLNQDVTQKDWEGLFSHAQQEDVSIYAIIGEPSWIKETQLHYINEKIDELYELDQRIQTGSFQGIMIDIEPYLLSEWDSQRDTVMDTYEQIIKTAYTHAKRYGYEVLLCIPYFFDDYGYESVINDLMSYCDEVLVMNYRKTEEFLQIETELTLASTYDRPLSVIYELQPPNTHDLTEENTYYYDGLASVQERFSMLLKQTDDVTMTYTLHDLQYWLELVT